MSSTSDFFDCPKCGGNAYREQDNRTCEITCGCSNCSWKGEPVDNQIQAYSKTTVGFVTQQYILKDDKYICLEQFFTAGDIVERNDDDGDIVEIDTTKEIYQEFNMQRPENATFENWFEENKKYNHIQQLFRGLVYDNPDFPLSFKGWAKQYYEECEDYEVKDSH